MSTDGRSREEQSTDERSREEHSTDERSREEPTSYDTAAFDVDGTLVDTNYQHALAWFRAFRQYDVTRPVWRIHRAIGMGGDQLISEVAGEDVEKNLGDELRAAWKTEFERMIDEVVAFEGAHELLAVTRERGFKVVLASSGAQQHTEHYIELLGAGDLIDAWTSSDDVEETKPSPDLIHAALNKVEGQKAILIGDSTWDAEAAKRAGALTYAVLTGGFSVEELEKAGADRVFSSLTELIENVDSTRLSAADEHAGR